MKTYDVTITETLQKTVSIRADSQAEAEEIAQMCIRDRVDRVRIDDIDIYKLPRWLEGIFEEVERICYETLEEESEFYNGVLQETHELLDKYGFLSTIADNDEIREPMNLSITEVQALSRFWLLETDRMSMEMVQMYLLGCRHMWELMELLGVK